MKAVSLLTDNEKRDEILNLIDELCDPNFFKNNLHFEERIQRLNKIYANGYRHTYSDISYKIQSVISATDSEVLEILGENLNVLGGKIDEKLLQNTDDANLKNTSVSFKKFSDHIKLEIGRYNFIRRQFIDGNCSNVSRNNRSNEDSIEELNKTAKRIDSLSQDIDKIRPIATEAQKQLDKLDEKLESNKISSITTLTIFSAVVLAFSGGITFEAGIFKGMAESSPYRIVFIIALTGFILFNTIFELLYLVGKMAGKKIDGSCKYNTNNEKFFDSARKCGEGYCKKEFTKVSFFCKILQRHLYAFMVNVILLAIMYEDFIFWLYNGQAYNFKIAIFQILPLVLIATYFPITALDKKIQEYRAAYQFKVKLITKIVEPQKELPMLYNIGQLFYKALGEKSNDASEVFLNNIENDSVVKDKEYKVVLKKLSYFSHKEVIKNSKMYTYISYWDHHRNKKKWKILKDDFRQYLIQSKAE